MAKAYPPSKTASRSNASKKTKGAPKDLGPRGSAGTRRSTSAPGNYTRTSGVIASQSPGGTGGKMSPAEMKANTARTKRAMKDTNRASSKATASRVAAKEAAKTAAKKVLTRGAGAAGAVLMAKDVYETIKEESEKSKSGATGRGRSRAAE